MDKRFLFEAAVVHVLLLKFYVWTPEWPASPPSSKRSWVFTVGVEEQGRTVMGAGAAWPATGARSSGGRAPIAVG